jgi:hypothetical protein
MKKAMVVVVAVLLLTAAGWAASSKGKEVTITGKISCTFCNLPAASNCSKECCQACIKSGDPVLLTDAQGNLYLLISGDKEKPLMTADRMNLLQEKVKVKGMLVKRGGMQGIYVNAMEKAI